MKEIKHKVKQTYQPDNTTCGYAAAAMLLSFYGEDIAVSEILKAIPQPKNEKGEDSGSVTTAIAAWLQKCGYKAHLYSFDCLVLDLSWKDLPKSETLKRLKLARGKRDALVFSRHWADVYIDSYIDMLKSGADLIIEPFVTSKLLYELLKRGPVYANICSTTQYGNGRSRDIGLRKSVVDDVKGHVSNHSTVIHGNDSKGNFLVADPWKGRVTIEPDTMIASITAAQIMCDNQCLVIETA